MTDGELLNVWLRLFLSPIVDRVGLGILGKLKRAEKLFLFWKRVARKKLNKKYRHTLRLDQYCEDCVNDKKEALKLKFNEYLEKIIKEDCKK